MRFFDSLCEAVTRALGLTALSPWNEELSSQRPLAQDLVAPAAQPDVATKVELPFRVTSTPSSDLGDHSSTASIEALGGSADEQYDAPGPVFSPPNSSPEFLCNYTAMRGWRHDGSSGSRTRWLSHSNGKNFPFGGTYDIFTKYDDWTPQGITRYFELNVTDMTLNADGVNRTAGGKAFNRQYPGPLIEACWGDTLEITVNNFLHYNGTTIHWHGVRMLNEFGMDGVNGVTQCPIAPNHSMIYKFRVTQYGTSWYHSHYSLQYPDGLAGPMTFYGPSSADYDEALAPFLFSDWSHNSAFTDFGREIRGPPPSMQGVILNGAGFFNCTKAKEENTENCTNVTPPKIFRQTFQRGRKYLLRLINTSTASTFIFSIDKHILQVVGMDFVPIEPYYTESVLVGIGQRYHVIVEARPSNDLIPVEDQNYWIRITLAEKCGKIDQANDLLGIVRYSPAVEKKPTTIGYQFPRACSDEPYESLVPVVPWNVTAGTHPENDISDNNSSDRYAVGFENNTATTHGNFTRWEIVESPMWLDFGNPTINHLHDKNLSYFTNQKALIWEDHKRNDHTRNSWVYLIISVSKSVTKKASGARRFATAAHPIHLHGHDFVILSQQSRPFNKSDIVNGTFKYDNPPRRDVALLPIGGYVAIGFKLDNPGVWLLHCHIAWHASSGLALQIIERGKDIYMSQELIRQKTDVCNAWDTWFNEVDNEGNHTNWYNPKEFQEDSGV